MNPLLPGPGGERPAGQTGVPVPCSPDEAAELRRRGIACLEASDCTRAVEAFSAAVESVVGALISASGEVLAHANRGDLAGANAAARQLESARRSMADSFFLRGTAHAAQEDLGRAIADFSRTLELAPGSAQAHLRRSLALSLAGDTEPAIADLKEAIRLLPLLPEGGTVAPGAPACEQRLTSADPPRMVELHPAHPPGDSLTAPVGPPTFTGPAPAAAQERQPAAILNPSPQAIECFRQGESHRLRGEWVPALAAYDEAIRLDPRCGPAYRERGQIRRLMRRLDDAVEDFTRAVELDATDVEAWLRRGNALADLGELDRAVADYDVVIRIDPGLGAGYLNRGLAHAKKGRFSRAVEDSTEAIRIDPRLEGAYFIRGAARAALGQYRQAIADFSQVLHLNPGHVLAYNERGLAFAGQGDYEQAIADYDRALALRASFHLARFNRAVALRLRGEPAAAIAELEQYLQHRPQEAAPYCQRGLAHLVCNEPAKALADFTRAIQLNPDMEEAQVGRIEAMRACREATQEPGPLSHIDAPATAAEVMEGPSKDTETSRPLLSDSPRVRDVVPASLPANPPRPRGNDRKDAGKVKIVCPRCGGSAEVPWDRLNKRYRCSGCSHFFLIDGTGNLIEPPSGPLRGMKGKEQGRRGPLRPVPGRAGFHPPGRLARRSLVAGVVLLGLGVLFLFGRSRPHPLEVRGAHVARAWLAQDLAEMQGYADPESGQDVERWLDRNPPPSFARPDRAPNPSIAVAVERNDGKSADVALRIGVGKEGEDPLFFVIYQRWVERDGAWYFDPRTGAPPPGRGAPGNPRHRARS